MPAQPVGLSALGIDLSPRILTTTTIVGSPALAAETIIAQLTIPSNAAIGTGIFVEGWCSVTIGTSGTACTMRVRQTNVSGTVIVNSGAVTAAAASVIAPGVNGIDTAGVLPGQVYVLTLQITAGAATSTVSAVALWATLV